MSDIITNREDVFLGKIAGRDVDISTWTPPVANGVREKILEEIADRIDELSENALPKIEEGDNGKVLGVADGAYSLVSGGGGGGSNEPLIVNCAIDAETHTPTGIDATYNEIKTAVDAGKTVYMYCDYGDGNELYGQLMIIVAAPGEGYQVGFNSIPEGIGFIAEDADTDMTFAGDK